MANVTLKRIELVEEVNEVVGYKSGLCLEYNEMARYVVHNLLKLWQGDMEDYIRFRPEEYEGIVFAILHGIGSISEPDPSPHAFKLIHKYKNDPKKFSILEGVLQLRNEWFTKQLSNPSFTPGTAIDPTEFYYKSKAKFGEIGANISLEVLNGLIGYQAASPWNIARRIEWENTIQLKELFSSESLDVLYGEFIDQRYIDYLSSNFDDIDGIHWRKFEALTCEFFHKNGYYVKIGEGRNDDGIDARVWPSKENLEQPPTIIIQCKRQKEKVGKTVVKALWADTIYEKAESGLLVTTSKVSPGAKKTNTARAYNVNFAERDTLKAWVQTMRTPNKGMFLAE